jgi:hypothetical protein
LTASIAQSTTAPVRDFKSGTTLTWSSLPNLTGLLLQLGLAILVFRQYQLESTAFNTVLYLSLAGFAVNVVLPPRYRLSWFVLVSLVGIALVFGRSGLWLVGVGLVLLAICHLPFAFRVRLGVLAAAVAMLIVMRIGWMPTPWPQGLWPILASMFMFRLIVYLYDLSHARQSPSLPSALAYFFMLPNLTFPLFPVIDFRTFEQTYYDAEQWAIYQRGVSWIVRGMVHLVLYRVVYYYLTLDARDVHSGADLVQYIVMTFMLYLRVSGQFHVVVGMLHLFGFHLPETNHRYLLSSSFIDLWRRSNIYWKNFVMKLFYYPMFFRLRRWGNVRAITGAMVVVFVATWFFHSFQWFWLRGELYLRGTDILFYVILASLMLVTSLREARKGRERSLTPATESGWSLGRAVGTLLTIGTLMTLWSWWSADSLAQWLGMWGSALTWTPTEALVTLGLLLAFAGVAGWNWDATSPTALSTRAWWAPLTATAPLAGLFVLGQSAVLDRVSPGVEDVLLSLQENRLNARDQAQLTRGYYEKVDSKNQPGGQLGEATQNLPADWRRITETRIYRKRRDFLGAELVPSASIDFKDARMSINRWGMRDKDYEQAKPPGTWRLALLGPSDVMGSGVPDGGTFEALAEDRLNRDHPIPGIRSYEILNFAVGNFSQLQQIELLESRVLGFAPDALVLTLHPTEDEEFAMRFMGRVVSKDIPVPYPELETMVQQAGATTGLTQEAAEQRLGPIDTLLVKWSLRKFAEIGRQHNLPVALLVLDQLTLHSRRDHPLVEYARSLGYIIMDLRDTYRGRDQRELAIAEWDLHPNARAHRLLGDRLYQDLLRNRDQLFSTTPLTTGASRGADAP